MITHLSDNKSPLFRSAIFCSQRHLNKHIDRQISKDISISVPMENARHDKTNVAKNLRRRTNANYSFQLTPTDSNYLH